MSRYTLLTVLALLAACEMPTQMTPQQMQSAIAECKSLGMTAAWVRDMYTPEMIVGYQCQPVSKGDTGQ